jgi:hypothetical protein
MTKQTRRRTAVAEPTPFEQARDELFQQVIRCGVIGADPEHQGEWFEETMRYFGERYPELAPRQVTELRTLGERFAQPPKSRPQEADAAPAA